MKSKYHHGGGGGARLQEDHQVEGGGRKKRIARVEENNVGGAISSSSSVILALGDLTDQRASLHHFAALSDLCFSFIFSGAKGYLAFTKHQTAIWT